MRSYAARRVGQAVLVLWAAYTLSFILLSALPGDAVNNRIQNPEANISPAGARTLLEYYGLDRPLWDQYLHSLGAAFRGDFGYSLTNASSVTELLGQALPSTLELTSLALVIGLVLAVVVALVIAYAPWSWLRTIASSVPALFASVPTFVVGILALQVFAFGLGVIPSVDDGSFVALIAPATTLGLIVAARLAQVLSASIRTTRARPFVHVLQAKGAGERYILRKDVLRNSSLPVLTLLGLACGELIAGSVVTEAVYARNGLGELVVGAVSTQDLPVVQGVVLVSALVYVVVNLAVDLAYPLVDPRVLVEGRSPRSLRRLAFRPGRRRVVALDPTAAVVPLDPVAVPATARESEPETRRLPVEVALP